MTLMMGMAGELELGVLRVPDLRCAKSGELYLAALGELGICLG